MEIRVDQLLLFLMVVLFMFADMVIRRLRNRGGAARRDVPVETAGDGGSELENSHADHEEAYGEDVRHEDASVLEDVFGLPVEEEVAPPVILPPSPVPQALPAVRSDGAPRLQALGHVASGIRRRRTMTSARDARRAIVLMAVFGPCRALEPFSSPGSRGSG